MLGPDAAEDGIKKKERLHLTEHRVENAAHAANGATFEGGVLAEAVRAVITRALGRAGGPWTSSQGS
jgi:hypothetical protein